MHRTDISVVIPTFRRPLLLARLLKSVARQTLAPAEVVVVDDASPERTDYEALLREFKGRFKSLNYVRNRTHRGAPACRNAGILRAKSPLIALVDDDDEWLPRKLEKQRAVFEKNGNKVDFVYNWVRVKDERGRVVENRNPSISGKGVGAFLRDISWNLPNPSATLIKRDCLLAAGLFDESLPGCQDWDMWIRILEKGYQYRPVRFYLTLQHTTRTGISKSWGGKKGFVLLALRHFRLFFRTNPLIFFHLAWFITGFKIGLRNKFFSPQRSGL